MVVTVAALIACAPAIVPYGEFGSFAKPSPADDVVFVQVLDVIVVASGSILTFESRMGFPTDSTCASLAHANRNIHRPQGC